MSISIKIEGIAGSHIEKVCAEAIRISRLLGIMVTFDFNGIHCIAQFGDDPDVLAADYNAACRRKTKLASGLGHNVMMEREE